MSDNKLTLCNIPSQFIFRARQSIATYFECQYFMFLSNVLSHISRSILCKIEIKRRYDQVILDRGTSVKYEVCC